jgi:hypothetical protein
VIKRFNKDSEEVKRLEKNRDKTVRVLDELHYIMFFIVSVVGFFISASILRIDIRSFTNLIIALWVLCPIFNSYVCRQDLYSPLVIQSGTFWSPAFSLLPRLLVFFPLSKCYLDKIDEKVIIDEDSLTVIEFGLTSSTFELKDGSQVLKLLF